MCCSEISTRMDFPDPRTGDAGEAPLFAAALPDVSIGMTSLVPFLTVEVSSILFLRISSFRSQSNFAAIFASVSPRLTVYTFWLCTTLVGDDVGDGVRVTVGVGDELVVVVGVALGVGVDAGGRVGATTTAAVVVTGIRAVEVEVEK